MKMLKLLRRHRTYFICATVTLATGVGVNLIVLSVVNTLWLRPLPVADPDHVGIITSHVFISTKATALESLGPSVAGQVITEGLTAGLTPKITLGDSGRTVETLGVTPEYFGVLGVVVRGRDFTVNDNRTGAEPVAIISAPLLPEIFGDMPNLIGAIVPAKPFPLRIIGTVPAGFRGARLGERVDVWVPSNLVPRIVPAAGESPGSLPLQIFARVPSTQSLRDVARHLRTLPVNSRDMSGITMVPLREVFGTPESRTTLIREGNAIGVATILAVMVLLGGCATLAGLVLVHYERRRRDLALMVALGASRSRVARELLSECAVLVFSGTTGAALIAFCGLRLIPSLSLPGGVDLSRLDLSVDWRVSCAGLSMTVLTLAGSMWLPLRRLARLRLTTELVEGSAATATSSSQHVRQGLLALQVCATVIVLVAAGLFIRAVINGFGAAPGFEPTRLAFLALQVTPSPSSEDAVAERTQRVLDALASLPGVESVALGPPPIGLEAATLLLSPTAIEIHGEGRTIRLGTMSGSPEILSTLGLPVVAGRPLTSADTTIARPKPAIMTASLARVLWPNDTALGQLVNCGARSGSCQIVGITRDFVFGSLARPAEGVVIIAGSKFGSEPQFIIRARHPDVPATSILAAVRGAVPDIPWMKLTTGREVIARDMGQQRLGAIFFSGFGLTALLLGIVGVFGLVTYLGESRRREFGVRLALGATPRNLVGFGLKVALIPVVVGLATGLILAAIVGQAFASLLIGLRPLDFLTYATVIGAVLVSASAAALGSAWRLRQVAPLDSLRVN